MKIAHVINSLGTGGAERLVVDLAYQGIKAGHQVKIILLNDTDGIPRNRASHLKIPVHDLNSSLKDPRLALRIRKAVADVDIVHVHLFPALYWSGFTGKPTVFTEHNTHNRRRNNPLLFLPERIAYRRYDRILAISEGVEVAIQDYLRKLRVKAEVSLALNGIADEFFSSTRNYDRLPRKVVSVGSLNPRKQHHLALQAISYLPNVELSIAGEGPLRSALEQQIHDLNLEKRVTLLGNVEDIRDLLQQSDLFLSTSEFEGFGIAAGEAQASGIPVVGPDVAGLREVVVNSKTGLLYQGFDPKIISSHIEKALDPESYLSLAREAPSHAMRFSIANSFKVQMAIYEEVLQRHQV